MLTEEKTCLSPDEIARLANIILTLQRSLMLSLTDRLSAGQVSFPQFFLLGHVGMHDALSMSEIADKMRHTTAAATGLVDRLEKLGYAERTAAPNDRRKVLVRITPKGRELVNSILVEIRQGLHKLTSLLTPEEQHMWLQIYEKIFAYCESQNYYSKTDSPNS